MSAQAVSAKMCDSGSAATMNNCGTRGSYAMAPVAATRWAYKMLAIDVAVRQGRAFGDASEYRRYTEDRRCPSRLSVGSLQCHAAAGGEYRIEAIGARQRIGLHHLLRRAAPPD